MNQMQNEQVSQDITPDAVQKVTEGEMVDTSLGKFKDVNALLNAYNSLQSEFTKRCQRIKELEGASAKEKLDEDNNESIQVPNGESSVENTNQTVENDKEEYLKNYLKNLLGSKQKAIVMSENGTSVKTPVEKPKSIFEAGLMAKNIL